MRLAPLLLVGFVCLLLDSVGCSSNEMTNEDNPPAMDGACSDNTGNRFVDCGNGTVTDATTGLIWLKNADCLGQYAWSDASAIASTLHNGLCGLTDHSAAGVWRLATADEWAAIVKQSCAQGVGPRLPDQAGTGCFTYGQGWASGVRAGVYWSSTPDANVSIRAFYADLSNGFVSIGVKDDPKYVWPVR